MQDQGIIHTVKRYRTLLTHKISVLPIVILMPHSACNCRCIMCDIWKGNKNSKQLEEKDILNILTSLKKLDTKRVVMSGGEALLNKNFFRFCEIIKNHKIKITLLSTGLTVKHHAQRISELVDEVIVSLDGNEQKHDEIRNIKGAYAELREGVKALKEINPAYSISGRCVIHRLNYKVWDKIIESAREIGLESISFLPADVSSQAFNRPEVWEQEQQKNLLIGKEELPELKSMIGNLISKFDKEFKDRFIVESPEKIMKINQYYEAHQGLSAFPYKECNAPWVSAVIEADGNVRPCFFHDTQGSIKTDPLHDIVNTKNNILYRKQLNTFTNPTCEKCVCYLKLGPMNTHY
jgi:Fe-coproporphyrin III synthase